MRIAKTLFLLMIFLLITACEKPGDMWLSKSPDGKSIQVGSEAEGSATLFSDSDSSVTIPKAGTAVIKVGEAVYYFDDLKQCETEQNGSVEVFKALGRGSEEGGRRTEFEMVRRVNNSGNITTGDRHERDFVRISVNVNAPDNRLQSFWLTSQAGSRRNKPGDDVWMEYGQDNSLPFILVRESNTGITATATANLSRQKIVPEYYDEIDLDKILSEGKAEFAVACNPSKN